MKSPPAKSAAMPPFRYRMISSIEISNFRSIRSLSVKGCAPINIIVGDNGAGKTTLLEAMFLAMCGSTQYGLMLRQYRGAIAEIQGNLQSVVEAIFLDFFHKREPENYPRIRLRGERQESRSLSIRLGSGDLRIPKGARTTADAVIVSPVVFEWTDSKKKIHRAGVNVAPEGLQFQGTGEKLPKWFFFAAQSTVPARESADGFSSLRQKGEDKEFSRIFSEVFDWAAEISVESFAGTPVLSVLDKYQNVLLPLPTVSGGANRMAAVLLAIAHQKRGIVLVDEIENGVFYTKQAGLCRALLTFARKYECQLFLTTHSQEWLRYFIEAAGKNVSDISLWRIERQKGGPSIERFDGRTFKSGIEHGAEVRRDQS